MTFPILTLASNHIETMRVLYFSICLLISAQLTGQLSWEEVDIPMTDGQSLKGDIYLPEGWTSGPVVLVQTPYNKNLMHLGLPIGIGLNQDEMGYAMVIVDWRGFWGSAAAAYQGAPTMGLDGYDVVQWIATQDWCDGNIGTWGPSALGKVQLATARENPPNLKCIVPVVASAQFDYLEYYPGGVYRTEYMEQLSGLGFGTSALVIANPYKNAAWNIAEALNYYPDEILVPTLMIAGWYDHNIDVMLPFFEGLQTESPENVRDQHRLLVGPWVHGGHGAANPGSGTQGQLEYPEAVGMNHELTWQFLDYHLKGIDNGMDETPVVKYFQMGDNVWLDNESWPPAEAVNTNYFFKQDGRMTPSLPTEISGGRTYSYNPSDPSPTIGGPTLRNDLEQGPYNQVPEVESRNDIAVFTTDILTEDVVLKGKAQVKLKISSDVTDTDFAIRLCDVYPDGRSMLVCDGIFRMRFKSGFAPAQESFMTPGLIYDCTIDLPNTSLTFLEGHRIRVDVTSSNYPRFNRNMNTGGEMYPNNNGDILVNAVMATNTVHTSSVNPSYITLPLVSGPPTVVIEEAMGKSNVFIYPNPAMDQLIVQSNHPMNDYLRITDFKGAVVYENKNTGSTVEIDLQGFAAGIYALTVQNGNKIETQRFMVK